ncbi:MAG: hypothetical protein K6E51_14650 [Treponema sp.]|nr:hypothetical protein [Treponema sp.]
MENIFETWLEQYFDEITPREFYRYIFPAGELDGKNSFTSGKYAGIAVCISQKEKRKKKDVGSDEAKVFRYTLTDDLDLIDELGSRKDIFCLMAPLSYAGKTRSAKSARFMYAMAFDLDMIRVSDDGKTPIGLIDLWNGHIEAADRIPKPTFIVSSGTGVHLYYVFNNPIPLFDNVVKQLQKMKHELTYMLWNEGIVNIKSENDIQYEGIFQGFRIPGTITKRGNVVRVFETGSKVSLEYLNNYVDEPYQVKDFTYKSRLSKTEAKNLYPEWYEERIVKKKKGLLHPWAISRNLYDWWKAEILKKAKVGHRYYCLMMLAIYAIKCGTYDEKKNPNPVTREELEHDAFEIMKYFETLTNSEDNHFNESDVLDALDAYDNAMQTYPRNSVEYRAGFRLPENKRNGRTQEQHVKLMNYIRDEINGNKDWRNKNGAPTKEEIVRQWQAEHPKGKKIDCERDTGLSRHTVSKWWKLVFKVKNK